MCELNTGRPERVPCRESGERIGAFYTLSLTRARGRRPGNRNNYNHAGFRHKAVHDMVSNTLLFSKRETATKSEIPLPAKERSRVRGPARNTSAGQRSSDLRRAKAQGCDGEFIQCHALQGLVSQIPLSCRNYSESMVTGLPKTVNSCLRLNPLSI